MTGVFLDWSSGLCSSVRGLVVELDGTIRAIRVRVVELLVAVRHLLGRPRRPPRIGRSDANRAALLPVVPERSVAVRERGREQRARGYHRGGAHERSIGGGAHPRVRALVDEPGERRRRGFYPGQFSRDGPGQPPGHLREGSERGGGGDRRVGRGWVGLTPDGHRRRPSGGAPGAPGAPGRTAPASRAEDAEARRGGDVPVLDDGDQRGDRTVRLGDHRGEGIETIAIVRRARFPARAGDPSESFGARRDEPRRRGRRAGTRDGDEGSDGSPRRRRRLSVPGLHGGGGERDVPSEHARERDAALQARAGHLLGVTEGVRRGLGGDRARSSGGGYGESRAPAARAQAGHRGRGRRGRSLIRFRSRASFQETNRARRQIREQPRERRLRNLQTRAVRGLPRGSAPHRERTGRVCGEPHRAGSCGNPNP